MGNDAILKNTSLRVLVLEDSLLDLELMTEQLTNAGYQLELTHTEAEAGFRAALNNKDYDIILSDYKLPGFDAFGALEISIEICPEVPFICVSGSIGEVTAIELLKKGAIDYVLKDRPGRLPFAVQRALAEVKEKAFRIKADRELKESENRFRQVAETAQEWIWEVDCNGLYTYASPFIESLLGYTPDEVVGKKYFYDLYPPEVKEELKKAAMYILSQKGILKNFVNTHIHKNGQLVCISTSGSPVFDDAGNLTGYRGADEDVTERKKMLEELVAAKEKAEESGRIKSAFINNISHEIRTPLNGILGFVHLMAEFDLPQEKRKEYFTHINNASDRLLNTITDYMDMAMIVSKTIKVNREEFVLAPVIEIITERTKKLCSDKNIIFKVEIPKENNGLSINSSSEFIQKILGKLLDNAIKFTKKGRITCGYRFKANYIEFFVKDTGSGIDRKKLEVIFEMFSQEDISMTREFEGSGLGLSIAKALAKLIDGNIEVSSERGKGSEFSFTLPYNNTKTFQAFKNYNQIINKENSIVLIAEDDKLNYLFLQTILGSSGYKHIHANNGLEAVNYCKQNPDISIVLMDIQMPVMNGIEATRQIREFKPELPIVATTAYAQTGDEQRFIEAGCNAYLSKPLKKEKLLALLKEYIQ